MFIISQYLLNKSNLCNPDNISTYSIAIGLVIYSSIYLYLLYYNNDLLFIFNKFIIFIIAIDLLLSTFYHFNTGATQQLESIKNDNLNFEDELLIENTNKIEENLTISDDELTEDFDEDLDEEIEQNNESENLENIQLQESYLEEILGDEPIEEVVEEAVEETVEQAVEEIVEQAVEELEQNSNLQKIINQINEGITNKESEQEPKPKAKRQPRKKSSKVDQVL